MAQPSLSPTDGRRKSEPVLYATREHRGQVFYVSSAGYLKTPWQSRHANFVSDILIGHPNINASPTSLKRHLLAIVKRPIRAACGHSLPRFLVLTIFPSKYQLLRTAGVRQWRWDIERVLSKIYQGQIGKEMPRGHWLGLLGIPVQRMPWQFICPGSSLTSVM